MTWKLTIMFDSHSVNTVAIEPDQSGELTEDYDKAAELGEKILARASLSSAAARAQVFGGGPRIADNDDLASSVELELHDLVFPSRQGPIG
jgi:hypothetical protein